MKASIHNGFLTVKGIPSRDESRRRGWVAERVIPNRINFFIGMVFLLIAIIWVSYQSSYEPALPTLILDGADRIVAVRFHGKLDKSPTEIRKWIGNSQCPREYQ